MINDNRTDEQLAAAFRKGESGAFEALFVRYKNIISSVARKFFLVGGDTEDLVQEGMCGLLSAANSFTGEEGFAAYAYVCIKNRIVDEVKKSQSAKSTPLNISTPISEADGEPSFINPEDALIGPENELETAQKMKSVLSDLEYRVIKMYVDGVPIGEISSALNITYKQADNAIMRAKYKLRGMFKQK